jgi:hypothetical protein
LRSAKRRYPEGFVAIFPNCYAPAKRAWLRDAKARAWAD